MASYRRHHLTVAAELTTALPGAAEALAAVRQAGETDVIITAKHVSSVGRSLAAAGLAGDDLFTDVHGPEKAAVLARNGAAAYVGDTRPTCRWPPPLGSPRSACPPARSQPVTCVPPGRA